jgi:GT2 family glycosyltransferase
VEAIGGIAPEFFMYYEDADLSWRLRLAATQSATNRRRPFAIGTVHQAISV